MKMKVRLCSFLLILGFFVQGQSQVVQIPVVIHILYSDDSENRTDQEIEDLIHHVNKGLRGLSENNIVSREIFDTLWADTEIQLCLAINDELGQPTNGIVRMQILNELVPSSFVFFDMRGLSNPWNTDKYLNIWLGSLGPDSETSGGIATDATNPHSTFPNSYLGISLNLDGYNPDQILIHEVGHYFGLEHLYFDDINDTPCSNNAINPEPECSSNFLDLNTCTDLEDLWGGIDVPDMIENYMEYYGNCSKMFTKGQKVVMHDFIQLHYTELISSGNTDCSILSNTSEQIGRESIKVFPNPAKDYLILETKSNFKYKILNISGNDISGVSLTTNNRIDISNLSAGIYILRVYFPEHHDHIKFVKL